MFGRLHTFLRFLTYVILCIVNTSILVAADHTFLIERTIDSIRQCMAQNPVNWPKTWEQQYLDTVQRCLTKGRDADHLDDRLVIVQKGVSLLWSEIDISGCHRSRFDLYNAEIQWYIEQLMTEPYPLEKERPLKFLQFTKLFDYTRNSLREQFPKLDPGITEAVYTSCLKEIQKHIEAPLNPLYARVYTEGQLAKIKTIWQKNRESRLSLWRQLSCEKYATNSSQSDIEEYFHSIFIRRCLGSITASLRTVGPSPPDYYQTALREYLIHLREQLEQDHDRQRAEYDLASTGIGQVERLSFLLYALMKTPACFGKEVSPDASGVMQAPTMAVDTAKTAHDDKLEGSSFVFNVRWGQNDPFLPEDLQGVFICDGKNHYRLSAYWVSPTNFLRATDVLNYCDVLILEDQVHLWRHNQGQLHWNEKDLKVPFKLPGKGDLANVMKSVFVALQHAKTDINEKIPVWHMARFFENACQQENSTYKVPNHDNRSISGDIHTDDAEIINSLPMERTYRKRVVNSDTIMWELRKGVQDRLITAVTVKRRPNTVYSPQIFDINDLGCGSLIPESYRLYWGLESRFSELERKIPVKTSDIKQLCTEANTSLAKGLPKHIQLGLSRLYFEMAVRSADIELACQAAEQYFQFYVQSPQSFGYLPAIELGAMVKDLRSHFFDTRIETLVKQLIREHLSQTLLDQENLVAINKQLQTQNWFWYGRTLFKTAESMEGIDSDTIHRLSRQLEIKRLAKHTEQAGPGEHTRSSTFVVEHLDNMQAPLGTLEITDLQRILTVGLKERFGSENEADLDNVVVKVITLTQRLAGKGPYRGDEKRLLTSIQRLQHFYSESEIPPGNMSTSLATLLVLSFHDMSTMDDHNKLRSQLCDISDQACKEVFSMLADNALDDLLTETEIQTILDICDKYYESYIQDPLLPMYKYTLTENEYTRCLHEMRCYLYRIQPQIAACRDERSKGRNCDFIKQKLIVIVTNLAQDLIPNSAFLRLPKYPGVRCTFQAKRGLYIRIYPEVYHDKKTDREVVMALKYFLVGNRIQNTVDHICKVACDRIQ
ncbi:MAG: hypothetical protein K9N55_20345 [Phycisphaerae bacterium]|nr:hypothetical protein [Phycisphaerae bacterium]